MIKREIVKNIPILVIKKSVSEKNQNKPSKKIALKSEISTE